MRIHSLLLGALLAFCLVGGRSSADSPWIYGIHWYGDSNSNDVEAMTGGKPIWVLETVMAYTGGWRLSDQKTRLEAVVSKGHSVVIRIEPEWGMAIPAPEDRAQYLVDIKNIVQDAANICHIWQIGNEMNLYGEYGGEVLTAEEYIGFYKQVRAAIKEVTSPLGDQIVLVGPVSPGVYFGEVRHTAGDIYLREMCQGLGPNDTDGFALHAYGAPWLNAAGAVADFMSGVTSQLAIIDDEGFCDKPAFILEWNRQTNPPSDGAQEAESAKFLMGAYRALGDWNSNPSNHPVVCAAWFIYPADGNWENFSIRGLRDVNDRGVEKDLWDSFQGVAGEDIPAGSLNPACDGTSTPSPTPGGPETEIEEEAGATVEDLSYQPANDDDLNGNVATRLAGGFHAAVSNEADKEAAFTDGASLGALTGLLMDYPGEDTPAWSGYWLLNLGEAVDLNELRVFSGNAGKDGRVFQHYDVYTTTDPTPGFGSPWNLVAEEVTCAPYGTSNPSTTEAYFTRLTRTSGALASAVTAMKLDLYAVSNTDTVFRDKWNSVHPNDTDGVDAAVESPLIFEVDAWFDTEVGPTPSPTISPTPSPTATASITPTPSPTSPPVGELMNGSFEDGFSNGVGIHWTSWTGDWSNPITFGDSISIFHDGLHAQSWTVAGSARFHGGVYQSASVTPGKDYLISAYMYREGSASDQWLEFGYDLTAGTAAEAASVVYTKLEDQGASQWVHYTDDFTATGNEVTLFAKAGHYAEDGSGNVFYVDEITLEQLPEVISIHMWQLY